MSLSTIFSKIAIKAAPVTAKVVRYGPEILLGGGVVATVGGTLLACKATLKLDLILTEAEEKIEAIKSFDIDAHREATNMPEEITVDYNDEDRQQDLMKIYAQTGLAVVKTYLPAVTTLGLGLACFFGSYNIQRGRIVGLIAAYKAVEVGFSRYRKNVVEDQGEDADRRYRLGIREEEFETTKLLKNGTEKTVKEKRKIIEGVAESDYARWYDKHCREWSPNPEYNLFNLKALQAYHNEKLRFVGHVFLNEIYDALGMERTAAGAVVGWVDENPDGDNYIDFGLYDPRNDDARRCINDDEINLFLDFNVDGVILDKI